MHRIHMDTSVPGVVVVGLEGEQELYGATELRRRLEALVEEGVAIVIDLTDATFIDSSVVSVLLETRKKAWDAGVRYAIVLSDEAAEPVRRMFQITRLDSILPVVHEREAALH
jgi:anti-anti-sigma factor